jgi:RimJ/RimL family protein N-acetyltransferase
MAELPLPDPPLTGDALALRDWRAKDVPVLVAACIVLSQVEWAHRRAMMSFWVAAAACRRGVATTAVRLLAGWALGPFGLLRLELFIEPGNHASPRLADRCGFVREGLLRSRWERNGRRRDPLVYGLLSAELRS